MNFLSQGTELRISSGNKSIDYTLSNIQSVGIVNQYQRQEVTYLGKYASEQNKPIVNYTPINLSYSYYKSDNLIEEQLGLLNPSGCFINLVANNNVNDYSTRDYKILYRPNNSQNYAGQINLYSGVLSNYSLNATVGTPISCSVTTECLDIDSIENKTVQSGINAKNIISSEGFILTGINFSGFGISGFQINSVSLSLSVQRNNSFEIGKRFPSKTIVDTNASIQINGLLNNITSIERLSDINNDMPYSGNLVISINDNCSNTNISNILIKNPYIVSRNISNQVGNFANVGLEFYVKPTIRSEEYLESNVIFY